MKKYDLFIGKEVEGPERNALTLFIPKNAKNKFSFLQVAKNYNIKRLYFGAGNDRGISFDLAPFLLEIPKDYSTLLEISSFDDLFGIPFDFLIRTKIIFVLKTEQTKILPSVFKIENSTHVHWFELDYPISTKLNDNLYLEDRYI